MLMVNGLKVYFDLLLSKQTHINLLRKKNSEVLFPANEWVFISIFIDNMQNTAYKFRYDIDDTSTPPNFESKSAVGGSFYSIDGSSTFYWGGDEPDTYDYCDCEMRYVRLYLNYVARSQDEMVNLAIMDPSSTRCTNLISIY